MALSTERISLSGTWQISRADSEVWQSVAVPGCWEAHGFPKDDPGPYQYKIKFEIPVRFEGMRIWLRFEGVSYFCRVIVNGKEAGRHTGTWDAFRVEITDIVIPGSNADMVVIVEKPASLTAGPDSPYGNGNFRLRETLSGFLPYIWGHAFGGIWQDVELITTGPVFIEDVFVTGRQDGSITIAGSCSDKTPVDLTIYEPSGKISLKTSLMADPNIRYTIKLPDPRPWSPAHPDLYRAHFNLPDGDEHDIRFGLREIGSVDSTLLLNGKPIYPRMILSWGWYPEIISPNPDPMIVRDEFHRLKEYGFNGVKLCLWYPPQTYFNLADEVGLFLWVELPLWLPTPGEHFEEQTYYEYERLVRAARKHPSVILYTLGCELDRSISLDFIKSLYSLTKSLLKRDGVNDQAYPYNGIGLVRDNSGSGETYGGHLVEFADFYDNHFYSDLQYLQPLLDHFKPEWRPMKPWLMGEFCDYDTFRDFYSLLKQEEGKPPWWFVPDPMLNPQGARWEYHPAKLIQNINQDYLYEKNEKIRKTSYHQGLLHRKVTIERIRANREVSGYVVTGEVDTPISTAGLWDDTRHLKYQPASFLPFNQDRVLFLSWDRNRQWIAGSDRVVHRDVYNYQSGTLFRAHLVLSNFGNACDKATVTWSAGFPDEPPFTIVECTADAQLIPGVSMEIALIEFLVPFVTAPRQMHLKARAQLLDDHDEVISNEWSFWLYPTELWQDILPFCVYDPTFQLRDIAVLAPSLTQMGITPGFTTIFTRWSPEAADFIESGGRGILIQNEPEPGQPIPIVSKPFWRESIKLTEPHPAWGNFPCQSDAGLQFYSVASQWALDAAFSTEKTKPIFRRLDARSLELHEYIVEINWGLGKLITTTLQIRGGSGDQPEGLHNNTAAICLLTNWLRYLQQS